MELDSLQPALDWAAAHGTLAGWIVLFIALGESLAVVGLFVPGAVLLFAVGALIGTGALPLGPMLAYATVGAILGDGLSFWLGHHYQQRLRVMWPLRRYPTLVARGVDFFTHHGGKSILLARFIGPLRPFVPAVAGMLGMSVPRYLIINLLSALLWAPVYILPGVVFGASLGLAGEVAGRLVLLIVITLATLITILWLTQRVFRFLQPRATGYLNRLLAWSERHPLFGPLMAALIDPHHPESRGLLVFAALLLVSGWAFVGIAHHVLGAPIHGPLDQTVYALLQNLRTPWADAVMVGFTLLGDRHVYIPVMLLVAALLLWRRCHAALLHWLAAIGFGALLVEVLKRALHIPRPAAIQPVLDSYAFPSGHTLMATVTYGFLAVLIARELPEPRRWLPYLGAALMISAIGLSRLYLGAHWLSDVLGGATLGLAWVMLLGIAYRRHAAPRIAPGWLLLAAALALTGAGGWHVTRDHAAAMARYAPPHVSMAMTRSVWWRDGWAVLPAQRHDLRGRPAQPMNLQVAGELDAFRHALLAQGWREPLPVTPANALRWLATDTPLAQLPVLPQVYAGRHQTLLLIRPETASTQWVIRLWPADVTLQPGDRPLWIGTFNQQTRMISGGLFAYPVTLATPPTALDHFDTRLPGWSARRERRNTDAASEVLRLQPASTD